MQNFHGAYSSRTSFLTLGCVEIQREPYASEQAQSGYETPAGKNSFGG